MKKRQGKSETTKKEKAVEEKNGWSGREKHLCKGCIERSSQSVQIMNGDSVFS